MQSLGGSPAVHGNDGLGVLELKTWFDQLAYELIAEAIRYVFDAIHTTKFIIQAGSFHALESVFGLDSRGLDHVLKLPSYVASLRASLTSGCRWRPRQLRAFTSQDG